MSSDSPQAGGIGIEKNLPRTKDELLAPLHPDERALSPLFRANIDKEMLWEIAQADYGEMVTESYTSLTRILQDGVADLHEPHVCEVLELTRWDPPIGLRGNWMQLFSSVSLLQLAARYPEHYSAGECETLAAVVSSALMLGQTTASAAASMVAARYLRYPGGDEDSAFFRFALLLLAVFVDDRKNRGSWLKRLAEWAEGEESRVRRLHTSQRPSGEWCPTPAWLFGLTPFRQFEGLWHSSAKLVLLEPRSPHPPDADEILRRLGKRVAEPD